MKPRPPARRAPPDKAPENTTVNAAYGAIVAAFARVSGVTVGAGKKKGFGAGALAVNGRIFAMVASRGRFVVKLPQQRVTDLCAEGAGVVFTTGPGRVMKEWLEVRTEPKRWLPLAREAHAFVAAA